MIPEEFPAGYIPVIVTEQNPLVIGTYQFPPATRCTLSQQRRINKTVINGRKGTIKEESGLDDWQVNIEFQLLTQGFVFSLEGKSMRQELKTLRRFWTQEGALDVTNLRMNTLGIKKLVLEKFSLPDPETHYQQKVQISALSDEDYKLGEEV